MISQETVELFGRNMCEDFALVPKSVTIHVAKKKFKAGFTARLEMKLTHNGQDQDVSILDNWRCAVPSSIEAIEMLFKLKVTLTNRAIADSEINRF